MMNFKFTYLIIFLAISILGRSATYAQRHLITLETAASHASFVQSAETDHSGSDQNQSRSGRSKKRLVSMIKIALTDLLSVNIEEALETEDFAPKAENYCSYILPTPSRPPSI